MLVKKGKSIIGKYYKDVVRVLKKLINNYQKRRLSLVLNISVFYMTMPPLIHTSAIMTAFLKTEKVTVLPHLPYSLDLAPCDFFMFPKMK